MARSWGGWAPFPLGHLGPVVIRGRLSFVSPFVYSSVFVESLGVAFGRLCLVFVCLCFVALSAEGFEVDVFQVEVFEIDVFQVEVFEVEIVEIDFFKLGLFKLHFQIEFLNFKFLTNIF